MAINKEDYLYISSLLRAREPRMLSRDKAERMLDAPNFEDAAKMLTDSGYEDMSQMSVKQIETALSDRRAAVFHELETLVPTLHIQSVYALLAELPGAKQIASCNLSHLKNLLSEASKGRYGREKAIEIRNAAQRSIGSAMKMKSMELQHTIRLIRELDAEICEIEDAIRQIMDAMAPPILTIPGISYRMGAMILAEIGDFSRFDSPDKILAYAGLSPSTYQSGKLANAYPHMEKRGSRYLRYALFNATKFVCNWDPSFAAYLAKKRSEGKHYNVAISHAAKKLVRIIFALMKSGNSYCLAT